MTVTTVFTDACTKYRQTDVLQWYLSGSVGPMVVSDIDGFSIQNPSSLVTPILPAAIAYMVNMRFKLTGTPGSPALVIEFMNGGTRHCSLQVDATRHLMVVGAPNILGTSATALTLNQWYIIECGFLVDDTSGRVQVKVDGVQDNALTSVAFGGSVTNSVDTRNGATTTIDRLMFTGQVAYNIDHLIIRSADAIWTDPGDWPGLVKKKTVQLRAGTDGDGLYTTGTDWAIGQAPAPGASQSDCLRELPFDNDTTFLLKGRINGDATDRDTFRMELSPALTASIFCVSHIWTTRQTVGGTHRGCVYSPSLATLYDSGPIQTDTTSYQGRQKIWEKHPSGATWTKQLFDELQIGLNALTIT
jgi:hypothetical protein